MIIVDAEKIQLSEMMAIENILAAIASIKKQEERKKVVDESFINFLLDKLNVAKV